jgi:hypothetical protein
MKIILLLIVTLALTGCGLVPEIAEMGTIKSESLETIENLSNTVNTTNIPIMYIYILAGVAWCIRTPWGLVSDFIGMTKVRRGLGL